MSVPPPLPNRRRPDWWSRNWPWFVPAVVILALGFMGAVIVATMALMKSNDAYRNALARTQANERVIAEIGEPIEASWMVTGTVSTSGGRKEADLAIPVQGPRGKATVYVLATHQGEIWDYEILTVHIRETDEYIDLTEFTANTP